MRSKHAWTATYYVSGHTRNNSYSTFDVVLAPAHTPSTSAHPAHTPSTSPHGPTAPYVLWYHTQLLSTSGHTEVVQLLLEHRAIVSATDHHSSTPLHFACQKGHQKCTVSRVSQGGGGGGGGGGEGAVTPGCLKQKLLGCLGAPPPPENLTFFKIEPFLSQMYAPEKNTV